MLVFLNVGYSRRLDLVALSRQAQYSGSCFLSVARRIFIRGCVMMLKYPNLKSSAASRGNVIPSMTRMKISLLMAVLRAWLLPFVHIRGSRWLILLLANMFNAFILPFTLRLELSCKM